MSTKTIGILSKDVSVYDIYMYIVNYIDNNAKLKLTSPDLEYISFWYEDENRPRMLRITLNDNNYGDLLGQNNKNSTVVALSKDKYSIFIIRKIVKHFGGWFFEKENERKCEFFKFDDEEINLYPFENKLFKKIREENDDGESVINTINFIMENKQFLISIIGNLLEENDKALLKCAFDIGDGKCDNCPLHESGKCSSYDEGGGFNKLGEILLKKLNII